MALRVSAIVEIFGRTLAYIALANNFGLVAKVDSHSIIEGVKRTLPMR
jgi:hypothetical protein